MLSACAQNNWICFVFNKVPLDRENQKKKNQNSSEKLMRFSFHYWQHIPQHGKFEKKMVLNYVLFGMRFVRE